MKKKILLIIGIVFIVLLDIVLIYFSLKKKPSINNVKLDDNNTFIEEEANNEETENTNERIDIKNLTYEYDQKVYLKDVLKIDIDGTLDTSKLGENNTTITNENRDYYITYKIKDTKAPLILGGTTKTTTLGKKINLVNKFLCGDNHDSKPNCYIDGEYDINKVGTYSLKYVAVDSSGNKSSKNFKLKVIKEKKKDSSSSTSTVKRTALKKYIDKYKKSNTKVGIDVSEWQGNIDWKKAKNNGVEFAMIRLGFGHNSKNELVNDKYFERNLKETKKNNIPRGIYFYSYAKTKEEAISQAKYIVKQLKGEKLELPIAFDWENWNSFNKYGVSFKELNDIANAFIEEVEKSGYKGMLYSSAYYLLNIWKTYDTTWLAYYTNNNDYKKSYIMWQLSSRGKVDGISGSVDINIMYDDKNVH